MNARALTGLALAAALKKAAMPAIAGALQRNGERLRAVADAGEGRDQRGDEFRLPSPPLWGRVGEGGTSSMLEAEPPDIGAGTPHPDPLPQGEREMARALAAPRMPASAGFSLDVTLSGEGLFAREFGAVDTASDPVLAPAIDRLRRRSR